MKAVVGERVSVVIPVFNGERYLAETIESVLGQTLQPYEIIIVDDGSTDGSVRIAQSFGPPVRVIRQDNRGESVARNRGIEAAEGDWIAFLDADDRWEPTKLALQLERCSSDTTCIHTNFYYFGDSWGQVDVSAVDREIRYSIPYVVKSNPFRISSVMIRRDHPARFPEWTQAGEDLIFFLELCRYPGIELVPEYVTGYRVHKRGQSQSPDIMVRRFYALKRYFAQRTDISKDQVQNALREFLDLMARQAVLARHLRQWGEYHTIKAFLRSYEGPMPPAARNVANELVMPRWVYTLKDKCDQFFSIKKAR